jgi:hypothetical protein
VSLKGSLSRLIMRREAPVASPPSPEPPPPDRAATLADLRARMQAVLERSARKAPAPPQVDTVDLPFLTEPTDLGLRHTRTLKLGATHRVGRMPIAPARSPQMDLLALLALDPGLSPCDPARALYLDTETTGLAGGTGTVAFLVGLAWFEDGGLVVEQLLVRNLGEEAPMLARVAERIANASVLVTFNGKSFDMPLLRTRFVMARMAPPREPPHLDLVHVARRLHKPRGVECKLTTLERKILGFERVDDVPSGDVSACYMHFLRTGDGRALLGVIEHNAWDVVAMAALVGLYGEPLEGTQLAPEDLVGVARTLRRAGQVDEAMRAADLAVSGGAGPESLRARAEVAKARGDKARALADFEALSAQIDCAKTRLELAKLYEHAVKEPRRALALVEQGTGEPEEARSKRARRLCAKAERSEQTAQLQLGAKRTRTSSK